MKLSYSIFFIMLIANLSFLNEIECILYGEKVEVEDLTKYKYLVGILVHVKGSTKTEVCGGGILDDLHILTAAHCLIPKGATSIPDFDTITVIAHTVSNRMEVNNGSVVRGVAKIYVLKSYFIKKYADIAVIKLNERFNLVKNAYKLQALQLPAKDLVTLDQDAVVAGYGAHELVDQILSSDGYLRTMDVTVVSDEVLDDIFVSARPSDSIEGYPRGFCRGDSGSPLVIESEKNIVVIGTVMSNSRLCDDTNIPGVYVRVTVYLDFINNALNNRIDSSIAVKDVSQGGGCVIQ